MPAFGHLYDYRFVNLRTFDSEGKPWVRFVPDEAAWPSPGNPWADYAVDGTPPMCSNIDWLCSAIEAPHGPEVRVHPSIIECFAAWFTHLGPPEGAETSDRPDERTETRTTLVRVNLGPIEGLGDLADGKRE